MKVGGDFAVVSDPTNSTDSDGRPRNNVLKIWASGPAVHPNWDEILFWRDINPNWIKGDNRSVLAPCAIRVDVFIPTGIDQELSLLGAKRLNTVTGDLNSLAAYELETSGNLRLYVNPGKGNGTRVKLKKGIFHRDEWNTLELVFEPDGKVVPIVNGVNAYNRERDQLHVPVGDYPAGFATGHAGILTVNQSSRDGMDGVWILNDNFLIIEYE